MRYSDEQKRQIIAYANEHGNTAAAKHFGMKMQAVADMRRRTTPKGQAQTQTKTKAVKTKKVIVDTRPTPIRATWKYSDSFQKTVAEYAVDHTLQETAEYFKIGYSNVSRWKRKWIKPAQVTASTVTESELEEIRLDLHETTEIKAEAKAVELQKLELMIERLRHENEMLKIDLKLKNL